MVELMTQNLYSHKINNRKSNVQNFKTVVQSQVEFESCNVEKLDSSIRPLFANPVTYIIYHDNCGITIQECSNCLHFSSAGYRNHIVVLRKIVGDCEE